jgi:hypothetical protein
MITFEVSPVAPNSTRIAQGSGAEAIGAIARELTGAVQGYAVNAARIARSDWHPFLMAAHVAFDQHYPLVFGPDDVWALICAGVARHVNAEAESLRGRIVRHEGVRRLTVRRDDFGRFGPNRWDEVVAAFAEQIRAEAGLLPAAVTTRFSTTGPVEETVFSIALMDAVQQYFSFDVLTLCGIPRITLLGTADDWETLRERARLFHEFDLGWWLAPLDEVLGRIVDTARGEVDVPFWQSLVKVRDESGGTAVTGWINVLFPYLDQDDHDGAGVAGKVRNRTVAAWAAAGSDSGVAGPDIGAFGSGTASVPVQWQYLDESVAMELVGGFIGVSQGEDGALRPAMGWAMLATGRA